MPLNKLNTLMKYSVLQKSLAQKGNDGKYSNVQEIWFGLLQPCVNVRLQELVPMMKFQIQS